MNITEKAAYLKGLTEGLGINESTNEGKIIIKLLELVEEMTTRIAVLEEDTEELYSYAEQMAEDIIAIQEDLYLDESDDYSDLSDEEELLDDEDDEYYEIECPSCGEHVCFADDLELDELICPSCGEPISMVDMFVDDESDMCEICDGCDEKCDEECDGCTKEK